MKTVNHTLYVDLVSCIICKNYGFVFYETLNDRAYYIASFGHFH